MTIALLRGRYYTKNEEAMDKYVACYLHGESISFSYRKIINTIKITMIMKVNNYFLIGLVIDTLVPALDPILESGLLG